MKENSGASFWFWIFAISVISSLSLSVILSVFAPTTQPLIDITIILGLVFEMLSSLSLLIFMYHIVMKPNIKK